jgi:spore coat protein JB
MGREQLELLEQIQAIEFTAIDLNLYLDTHPDDQRAMTDFANAVCQMQSLHAAYVSKYHAPVIVADLTDKACWSWVTEPWPWQIEY